MVNFWNGGRRKCLINVIFPREHSHFPGWASNFLICKDINFESIWYQFNKINVLYYDAGKMGTSPPLKEATIQDNKSTLGFSLKGSFFWKNGIIEGSIINPRNTFTNFPNRFIYSPQNFEKFNRL